MSAPKTIHDVAEMFGIPKATSEMILEQIKANTAKLDGCVGPHDFSIALDRLTRKPIDNPPPQRTFGSKWQCSKCGGYIEAINRSWYNRGLKDAEKT